MTHFGHMAALVASGATLPFSLPADGSADALIRIRIVLRAAFQQPFPAT